MKKTFQILGAAMLALAVVGCENEPIEEGTNTPVTPDEPVVEEPAEPAEFALYATLPATRTTLSSDFKLSWNNSDVMAVFNAPTGTEDYSGNLKFVIDENAEGKFTPAEGVEVPYEEGVNYDWFVLAPHRENTGVAELTTPKGESKEDGYFPIGAQTQTGYNSSVHVSSQDIMVGKATNTRTPSVELKHLAVLHKFTVTNNSSQPTIITKLTLNGGENKIFGTFWIDLTADEPAIDIAKANGTFNERALTVKEGTELAVGESADFYVVTAPFTLNTGETFKVTIATSTGTQVVEKTAESDITFAAGTYNTANLVYDLVPEPTPVFLDTFGPSASYDKSNIINSNVSNIVLTWDKGTGCGSTDKMEGGALRFSSAKANSLTKWEKVAVDGNSTLTVSYDLLLTDKSTTNKVTFKYKVTGASRWTTVNVTELTEADVIKQVKFDITVDPAKTIDFHIVGANATSYTFLDNMKLDVPATE